MVVMSSLMMVVIMFQYLVSKSADHYVVGHQLQRVHLHKWGSSWNNSFPPIFHLFDQYIAWDVLETDVIQETSHLFPEKSLWQSMAICSKLSKWLNHGSSILTSQTFSRNFDLLFLSIRILPSASNRIDDELGEIWIFLERHWKGNFPPSKE